MRWIDAADRLEGALVVDGDAEEIVSQRVLVTFVEMKDAVEVARCADVHGVRERAYGGPGGVRMTVEELRHHVVGVRRRDEAAGQAEATGEEAGRQVAEVSTRRDDAEVDRPGIEPLGGQLMQQMQVVERTAAADGRD